MTQSRERESTGATPVDQGREQPAPDTASARWRVEWPFKWRLLLALWPSAAAVYALTMHWVPFPVTDLQPGFIDRAIPFLDSTAYVYASMYLMPLIAFALLTTRSELIRFAIGMVGMTVVAGLVFLLHPTRYPRIPIADPDPLYQLIVSLDKPLNCFPSLHAAYAVYAALMMERSYACFRWPGRVRALVWLWATAILLSTLTTKQHAFIDIVAGSLLALLAWWIAVTALRRRDKARLT